MENKSLAFDYLQLSLLQPGHPALNQLAAQLGPADSNELHQLLPAYQAQLAGFQRMQEMAVNNTKNTFDTLINLKRSLDEAMTQAKKGYAYVMWMYVVVFYTGIALIVTAVVFAAMDKTILAIAFGAVGLADIITYLMVKPPLELQTSRSNYAQLTAALISWFTDLMNLNTYMATLPPGTEFARLEEISKKQLEHTEALLELIEKYSEPGTKAAK